MEEFIEIWTFYFCPISLFIRMNLELLFSQYLMSHVDIKGEIGQK